MTNGRAPLLLAGGQGSIRCCRHCSYSAEYDDGLTTASHLEAETSTRDVQYHTDQLSSLINPDGSGEVRLPSSIGELQFDNIRAGGAPPRARVSAALA